IVNIVNQGSRERGHDDCRMTADQVREMWDFIARGITTQERARFSGAPRVSTRERAATYDCTSRAVRGYSPAGAKEWAQQTSRPHPTRLRLGCVRCPSVARLRLSICDARFDSIRLAAGHACVRLVAGCS